MTLLVALPILIPLCTGTVCVLCWGRIRLQRIASVVSGVANLVAAVALLWHVRTEGILVSMMGNWPPPFGIALVADLLSAIMVVLSATMGLTVLLYSFGDIDRRREQGGYYPLFHLLLMGINGSFLTGDLFNLFVFFEVMLIASYVLLSLGGEPGQLQESFKYLVLNLLASTVFVASVGILYAVTGTLNMADLALKIEHTEQSGLMTALSMLFLFVFGVKAAIFPLFFWLPDAYPEPPTAVSAIFGGLLTKVGVYALIRTFTLLFVQDTAFTHSLILVLAALTMIVGVLGAIVQNHFKRILSYHIISQIGYMILGLGLYTPLALAGAIFYIIHHITVKTALFLDQWYHRARHWHPAIARHGGAAQYLSVGRDPIRAGSPVPGGYASLQWLFRQARTADGRRTGETICLCGCGTARQPADLGLDEQDLCLRVLGRGEAKACTPRAAYGSPPTHRFPGLAQRGAGPRGRTRLSARAAGGNTAPLQIDLHRGGLCRWPGDQVMAGLFLLNLMLALTWAALQGELDTSNLVIGFLISAALIYLFRRMFFRPSYFRKVALALTMTLVFIKELLKSNIAVLRIVFSPRARVRSGVIAVPTELTNNVALTMLANMITLTPGTLTLDISPDRRYLYVHTLNLDDPEDVKQEIHKAFEVYLRELSR